LTADSESNRPSVLIYTDGACSGNPGPGGWGAILLYQERDRTLQGGEALTTNNRMELLAAIRALEALTRPCRVELYSDSAYLINAFALGWLKKWQKNGWLTASKEAVVNQDLWQALLALADIHRIDWRKVKGHSDNPYNNRCDAMAVSEAAKYKKARGAASR
jgi:ribonuclease HI